MKTKHARHIRAGIYLARMAPRDLAWALTFDHATRLTRRAFKREDLNVLRRMLQGRTAR